MSANTQLDHDNFLVCLSTETVEELTQLGQMRDTALLAPDPPPELAYPPQNGTRAPSRAFLLAETIAE